VCSLRRLATTKEHHDIMFLFTLDRQKYGKLIEQMKNEVLQKMDTFPKPVKDECRILARWKNNYGDTGNKVKEADNGMAVDNTIFSYTLIFDTNSNKLRNYEPVSMRDNFSVLAMSRLVIFPFLEALPFSASRILLLLS